MSLFESKIDFEFVYAVKAIARELEELNKNLKENKAAKPELAREEKNLIWHEIQNNYDEETAKCIAEDIFSGTYLYDILTEADWIDIVEFFRDKYDMTLSERDQLERTIEGIMYDKHIADYDNDAGTPNWADVPYVMAIGTEDDQLSDLDEFFEHLKMNGYHFIRITDSVTVIDGEHLSYATTCAVDRNLTIAACSIKLPESWYGFSGISLKQRCIDTIVNMYFENTDLSTEEREKIESNLRKNLSRCSREV